MTYPDWEMHVHFQIHGEGKNLFGDGIAIWYVKDPKLTGKNEYISYIENLVTSGTVRL